jgi:N6-adenosine-specific RNA methylase IME4
MGLFNAVRAMSIREGRTFKHFCTKAQRSTYVFNPWDPRLLRRLTLPQVLGLFLQALNLHHGEDYPTMTIEDICREPVKQLAMENAHLHLWTTNAFLREAFDVMQAWGFQYKSCLIWIKPQLGMGNYWRVSHEYLLLGVRGSLPFRKHACQSWLSARRTIHGRKPSVFRKLIEQVSPGPYLELNGREEQPNTNWTVYGNQVDPRLF